MFYFQLGDTCGEVIVDCPDFALRSNAKCTGGDYMAIISTEEAK